MLESNNIEDVRYASSKLKMSFRNKIEELKSRNSYSREDDLDTLFNKTIFHIYSQPEDQKRKLINKLAWSLSNETGSVNLFEDILNYMETQE